MTLYCYSIEPSVSFEDVMATLDLALVAVQSLHGEARTCLDARFSSDEDLRRIDIDATTDVGQAFNDLFVGYVVREFGMMSFKVERKAAKLAKSPCD